MIGNAGDRGAQLISGLRKLQGEFPAIGDVRGAGLMIGTEFIDAQGKPDAVITTRLIKYCTDHNLLLLSCGTYGNVIRWIPPLMVSAEQIDAALQIFAAALDTVQS
jgi:4-aminobutyrate aminotransferase